MKSKDEQIKTQQELIDVLYSQVVDLSMMSKIELGDDVIAEIKRLKDSLKQHEEESDWDITLQDGLVDAPWETDLYSQIEQAIISWSLNDNKTAGELTREIMSYIGFTDETIE